MKRILIAALAVLLLTGCGRQINRELPPDPIAFRLEEYSNPADPKDGYMAFRYQERRYIPFGTLKNRVTGEDVGACLGYLVQDGKPMEDVRLFPLTADPENNFLMCMTEGFMDQPTFYRAEDTKGKLTEIPPMIEDLGYDFWK